MGVAGGVDLPAGLRDRPAPARAIDGEHGPARAVLVAEMDEDRGAAVFDADAVGRVVELVEAPREWFAGVGDERRPPRVTRPGSTLHFR